MTKHVRQSMREPWYYRFHDLMAHRVREILLVSSPYDAFILEEDGRLTERLFVEYSELNLSSAPRITHAPTGARAMELLKTRSFDLIITMTHLEDTDAATFSRLVKADYPHIPVVLLTYDEAELFQAPGTLNRTGLDRVFLWTGDAKILLAIIKLIEDERNVASDTASAGVQVIIVVEDSVRRYSSFLCTLYTELMAQSQSLIAEGLNDLHKLVRMRARPKVLLASNFEDAVRHYTQFRSYLMAVISDVRFPRNGVEDSAAGYELVRMIRREDPDLPVVLQSADPVSAAKVRDLGAVYLNKNSPRMLRSLRHFMLDSLGFGDFVFRLPDRREVARAKDMYEMQRLLETVPAESVEYHAMRNHFSMWLRARSMFALADLIGPRTIAEFKSVEEVRAYLLEVLRKARQQEQEGVITDFSTRQIGPESAFVRVGKGSLGGKGRSIAFANAILAREGMFDRFENLEIRTPRSAVIGTEEFDRFLEENRLLDEAQKPATDVEITQRFLDASLPGKLSEELAFIWKDITGPVAVRSSSLLEDSHLIPFAGIYATYMLPNNHPDPAVRFDELCRAVRAVYASAFHQNARDYMRATLHSNETEKMSVVVQEMVGRLHGKRFYPSFSGTGLSYNYYPVGSQTGDDGVALVALGLGQTVVLGGATLRFSPGSPDVLPQFPRPRDFLKYSQNVFYALDMSRPKVEFLSGTGSSLCLCDLKDAEADGTLSAVGSVYCADDDVVREDFSISGPRVVTFNNVLKWGAIPLAAALNELLRSLHRGMGGPVEIEFAVDMADYGSDTPDGSEDRKPCLYVLQVRPLSMISLQSAVEPGEFARERIFCRTTKSLGHGVIDNIRDIVYVKQRNVDALRTRAVANQIDQMNAELRREGSPYLLIGPGRWGSSDASLGIPAEWRQISGARVIMEVGFSDRAVEPSQGTHFFHNITSLRIGYMTLSGVVSKEPDGDEFIDAEWLDGQPAYRETTEVRHVRLGKPLTVYLDGRRGIGTIIKPE